MGSVVHDVRLPVLPPVTHERSHGPLSSVESIIADWPLMFLLLRKHPRRFLKLLLMLPLSWRPGLVDMVSLPNNSFSPSVYYDQQNQIRTICSTEETLVSHARWPSIEVHVGFGVWSNLTKLADGMQKLKLKLKKLHMILAKKRKLKTKTG